MRWKWLLSGSSDYAPPRLPTSSPPVLQRRRDEPFEERVRSGWLAFEFGVKLHRDVKGMLRDLDDLAESAVG